MERAVLEMILNGGAADPADPAIDDNDLSVVDMPKPREVPPHLSRSAELPTRYPALLSLP